MPFGSFNLPPTGGAAFSAAGYTTLLASARATGTDGDICEDTDTGALYNFLKGAGEPGILVPGDVYGETPAYITNASGKCYIVSGDADEDVAALVTRGWATFPNGNATLTGGEGSPFTFSSGTDSGGTDSYSLQFTPTGTFYAKNVIICRAGNVSGAKKGDTRSPALYSSAAGGDDPFVRLSLSSGTAGKCEMLSSSSVVEADLKGAMAVTSAGEWYIMMEDVANDSIISVTRLDLAPQLGLRLQSDEAATTTLYKLLINAQETGSGLHSFNMYEIHWIGWA